jgi:hypothetical protein
MVIGNLQVTNTTIAVPPSACQRLSSLAFKQDLEYAAAQPRGCVPHRSATEATFLDSTQRCHRYHWHSRLAARNRTS